MNTKAGSIIERPRKDGGISYQAMVKIPGSKAAVETFRDRDEAVKFLECIGEARDQAAKAKKRRAQNAKQAAPGQLAELNQEDWANEWLNETLNMYGGCERVSNRSKRSLTTIRQIAGDVKLGELDKKWVREYIKRARAMKTRTKAAFKWSSIVCHMRTISAAMAWRADEMEAKGGALPFSKGMMPSNWECKRTRRLSGDEERRLLARLRINTRPSRPHWVRMFRLALRTAARLQELVLAEWSEFDLKGKFWIIPASHTKCSKERVVPLDSVSIRALKAMKLIQSGSSNRVFHEIKSAASASSVFSKTTRALGIADLRFHDLRHEAITRMVLKQRKKTVFELMEIVGHSSIEMLQRYTNLRGDEISANWIG